MQNMVNVSLTAILFRDSVPFIFVSYVPSNTSYSAVIIFVSQEVLFLNFLSFLSRI